MAQIVQTKNPLFPVNGREQYFIRADLVGKSLKDVLVACDINLTELKGNTAVFVNDERIDHDQFENVFIDETDHIAIKALVSGGGGSNVFSIIALIALVVLDVYTFGADSAFVAAYGSTMGAIAGAAVLVVGGLLINKFLGPSFPSNSLNGTTPTYAITGTSNQARVGQPMPIVFGTYLMAPDVGANPYVVYEGNNQYLYEIFNFGYSNLEIGPLMIGGTPVSNFSNVTTQWSTNGALTLFPGNVDVSTGAQLTQAGGPITRTTSVNCTSVGIDIQASLFVTNSDGSLGSESVTIYPQYKLTTATEWSDLITTSSSVNSSGETTTPLGPLSIPNGTNYNYNRGNYSNYQSRNVWTLTNDSSTPYYETFTANLPAAGQYDIKLTRLTADIDDTTHYADTTWTQLKSYQPDNTDYSGQTRLAIKIEANNQLNGTITQLQAQVSAKCPVYNSTTGTWSTTTTSNPAWWFLWFARGLKDANGVRILGCGLADSQIDIAGIIEWAGWCDANSLQFNYILGDAITSDDALNLIARVGRGTKTFSKGVLGVVYDQEGLPVTQMFGMSNIKAGSFTITYTSDQLAQQINVQFINPDLQYAQDQVSAIVPGVTSPEYTSTVFIPGITSKTQAAQEANLQASAQTLFRKTTVFETDIEGLVSNRGDVITVSHDLANWSYSGRLASGTTTSVVLDREVTISASTQPYLSVRHPDGTIETVEVDNVPGVTNTLTLLVPLSQNPSTYMGLDGPLQPRDAIYSFDPAQTPGRKMKVLAVEPQGNADNWVKLTCRDEIDAYYDSATNPDWTYTNPALLNQGVGTITNITFSETTNPTTREVTVSIGWTLHQAVGARLALATGNGPYVDEGVIYGQTYVATFAAPTTITVQLTPVALAELAETYPTVTASYAMIGTTTQLPETYSALVPAVTGLQIVGSPTSNIFTGADAKFEWRITSTSAPEVGSEPQGGDSSALNPYFKNYLIQILNTDGTTRRNDTTVNTNYTYTLEMNSEDGGGSPARAFTINVTAEGQQNQVGKTASLSVSNPPPAVPTGIVFTGMLNSIALSFNAPTDLDYAGCLIYGSTSESASASTSPLLIDTKLNNQALFPSLTPGATYYFYLSPYDQFGKTGLNVSSQYTCATVLIATIDLGPGTVTAEILAEAAVQTANINVGAITSELLASQAVNNAALALDAVATANIQPAAVTNAIIAANAVDSTKLAASAVTTAAIAAGAVTTANLATAAVTAAILATGAVTAPALAANSVTAASILAGTITSTQISTGTITAGNIASGTITSGQIAASTITGANIQGGTITGSLIAGNTIIGSSLVAGTITSTQIASNTITGGNILAGSITSANIAAGTITATNIAANTITASQIAALTITTNQIAANTILGSNIAAATITGANIVGLTITADKIAANSITSGQIAANTIVAGNIAANTITAAQLAVLSGGGTTINLTNGLIVINNGTAMTVQGEGFGASSQFLEWRGPTQSSASNYAACTTSNAVSYVTTSGDAYFAGGLNFQTGSNSYGTWIKYPADKSGRVYIQQFGTSTASGGTIGGGGGHDPNTVTYPMAFPTVCLSFTANPIYTGGGGIPSVVLQQAPSASNSNISVDSGGFVCVWQAFGY
jgi:hypothetical protein